MKERKVLFVVAIVAILTLFLYGCVKESSPKIPGSNSEKEVKIVNFGEEFTLFKGESAQINELNVSLKLNDFIYSPCPKGVMCVWSGLAVVYELNVNGTIYVAPESYLPQETPYNVFINNTDYKTFATFVIDKPENSCTKLSDARQDECWGELAKRFNSTSYCDNINSLDIENSCYEDLAEKQNNGDLCANVTSPKQYCQYLNLVKQNNLAECDSITTFHWRVRCFKEIAETNGKGIEICNTLDSNKAQICKEMISGSDY